MSDWYEQIEEPIRPLVKLLRDNGINTTSSCGHKMYVQADLMLDGQLEVIHKTLFNYLAEKKLSLNYDVEVHLSVKDGWPRQCFVDISFQDGSNL